MERRGEDVIARALAWLDERRPGPFLLWVHLYDAHDPYDAPEPFGTRFAAAPYDGEIAYVDAQVGRLLAALGPGALRPVARRRLRRPRRVARRARRDDARRLPLRRDHPRAPRWSSCPAARPAGQRVAARAGLVDLAPTRSRGGGLAVPAAMQGESLLPLIGTPPAERPGLRGDRLPAAGLRLELPRRRGASSASCS